MKQFLTIILAGFSAFGLLHAQKKASEQDAIRKVIELETKSYYDGNYDQWAKTWAQEPTSYVITAGPNNNSETIGWENISASVKPRLKNVPLISAEEYANYAKDNYTYKINGNLAHLTYKEGKGNFQSATLEKQNGEWKIIGKTTVRSTDYKIRTAYNSLKSFVGKWKMDLSSYKREPADSKYQPISYIQDIHEGMYGIEFKIDNSYTFDGKLFTPPTITEQFLLDYNRNEIKYFDFEKNNNGIVSTYSGTASFDNSGNFVIKAIDPDKPATISFENVYTPKSDGSMHFEGRTYNNEGKVTFTWSFDLLRM